MGRKDYEPLPNCEFVIKYKEDFGLDCLKPVYKPMSSHPRVFVLSHIKKIMNKLVGEIDALNINHVYCQDTDSLYFHIKYYQKLEDANCVGNNLGQVKIEYGDDMIFSGVFRAPK